MAARKKTGAAKKQKRHATESTIARARAKFLGVLAKGMSVSAAAAAAAVDRTTVYRWRKASRKFAADWDNAVEAGTDVLEDEAMRRAVTGVHEPLTSGGKLMVRDGKLVTVARYSDTLMCLLLKSRRPEKYRERVSAEHSGPKGAPIPVSATVTDATESGKGMLSVYSKLADALGRFGVPNAEEQGSADEPTPPSSGT